MKAGDWGKTLPGADGYRYWPSRAHPHESRFLNLDSHAAVDRLGAPVPSIIVQVTVAGGKVEPFDHAGNRRIVALPLLELVWFPCVVDENLARPHPSS